MVELKVELKVAKNNDAEEWDELVELSPHATIFHKWKWLKIVEKHANFKLYPIIGYKGSTPIGLIPLFFRKRAFLRMVFSPPPKVAIPCLGPLLIDYEKLKQNKKETNFIEFQKRVDEFMKEELKANYIYITLPIGLIDVRPFIWSGYSASPSYNYVFNLSLGKDVLWKNLKKHTRKNIKRAKERLTVTEGDVRDLRFIYSQLKERYQEQKRAIGCSLNYLEEVYTNFRSNIQILTAEMDGETVAGLVNLLYRNSISSWVGNAKTNIPNIYPNDLLIWESIEYGCNNGYGTFYEIGANTARLARYKSNFNPSLVLNFNVRKHSLATKILEGLYVKYRNIDFLRWG